MPSSSPSLIVQLLRRFNYAQKFIIIGILFGISILISAYFMIAAQNTSIRFAEKELIGIQYERTVRRLLETIPEHKMIAYRQLSGNENLKAELINLETEIQGIFRSLVALNAQHEELLRTSPEAMQYRASSTTLQPAELEKKWNDLVKRIFELSPQVSNTIHDQIVSELQGLLLYIAETSNLILDPEVHSYYLMFLSIYQLPQVQSWIPQLTLLGDNILSKKGATLEDKAAAISLIALLKRNTEVFKSTSNKFFESVKLKKLNFEYEGKLRELSRQYLESIEDFLNYAEANILQPSDKPSARSEFFVLGSRALKNSFALCEVISDQLEHILNNRIRKLKTIQLFSVLASLISALIGFGLGYIVMREINRPLVKLVDAAKHLTAGDLSTRVPTTYSDEVGQVGIAFNQMAESFQELIGQLQWTGIQLTTSTTEIAAAAKQQEATVVEQEATTKQIAVTAREISTTAKEFAKTMNEVSSNAEQTSSLASSGKAGLSKMETIMHQMVDASQNIASKLAVLNEKAGNITSVVTTISKVADQTNLLSLNAAIEAEKAGEHGRSFAVIAREIRRLADQTANATLDIEKMVNEMVSAVSAGVMGVDKFSEEIHTGVRQVGIVSEQLAKIILQVQQQTSSFETVNQGMQAQSLGAEQIDESIKQLSDAAQQTTESIRQFNNAVTLLNSAVQDMQTAVSKLKR